MSDSIDRRMEDAARTLRDATGVPATKSSEKTRARILASHRAGRSRTEQLSTWLVAAAALLIVLGGSTAWAYWTGRLDHLIGGGGEPSTASHDVEATSTSRAPHTPAPRVDVTTPIAPAPAEILAPEVVAPEAVQPEAVQPEAVAPEVLAPEPVDTTVDPAERRAYREAHALHFEQHDDAGAIAGWDRYLASYPRGRFALEARYNRALCLVRSGRETEAREALAPFVEGTHGGYRQREASEIVDALDAP